MGFTVVDPTRVEVEKFPGVIATEEAFAMLQESVLVPAEATTVGAAVKEEMTGGLVADPLPAALNAAAIDAHVWDLLCVQLIVYAPAVAAAV